MGKNKQGRIYIGKTIEAPENRWTQHRNEGTGPFKGGDQYVEWKIVQGEVPLEKLDELESYYIGFYNSYENGYNENRGNDYFAYERGQIVNGFKYK